MNCVRQEDIQYVINNIPYEYCENKVFLITGANGFLASYIVDTLMTLNERYLTEKCTVIALCRSKEKARKQFGDWLTHRNFVLLVQGVEEPIKEKLQVDYIIHAASGSSTAFFSKNPVDILKANVIGTYNLLELGRNQNISGFLFFSSGAVYGDVTKPESQIKETDVFTLDFGAVQNCYAEGKRGGEALCQGYFKQYGLPTKIVRIGHTYGPGIDLQDGHVYSDFVSCIVERKNLVVRNGGVIRPFCYVADAVIAFFKILFEGESGGVYNMVNNKETISMYDLALKLAKEVFPERKIGVECLNNEKRDSVIVSNDKLAGLGWDPSIDIKEGFMRTVRSFEQL